MLLLLIDISNRSLIRLLQTGVLNEVQRVLVKQVEGHYVRATALQVHVPVSHR